MKPIKFIDLLIPFIMVVLITIALGWCMWMIAEYWNNSLVTIIVTLFAIGILVALVTMIDLLVWQIRAHYSSPNQKALVLTKYIKLHRGVLPTLGLASRISSKLDNFVEVRYKIKLFTDDDNTGLFGNADDFEHILAGIIEDWIMEDIYE